MQTVEMIGFLASGLSIVSGLPQVAKTFRSRSAGDLSLATLLLAVIANGLWIGYAVALALWPVLLPNLFSFAVVASLITMKLAFDQRPPLPPATKGWPAAAEPEFRPSSPPPTATTP